MRRNTCIFLLGCSLIVSLTGCGKSESSSKKVEESVASTPGESGADNSANNNGGGTAGDCTRSGFDAGTKKLAQASTSGWAFSATSSDQREFLSVSSFVNSQGPTTPGTYELTGVNYKDCGLCLFAGTGCGANGCTKYFYAHKGTVEITQVGTENGVTIAGKLKNVVLEEVTIAQDYTSTKVANGQSWCMNDYAFSEKAVDPSAPKVVESFADTVSTCVTAGNGTGLGNNIANLELVNCNGDTVKLHDRCETTTKAVWYVHTAGWCGACEQWLPQVNKLYNQEKDNGLQVYYVLGEDANGSVPTQTYCKSYAERKGLNPAHVLIDNSSSAGAWGMFSSKINMYQAEYIPWNAILRASNMEYLWADNVTNGTITNLQAALQAALGKTVDITILNP